MAQTLIDFVDGIRGGRKPGFRAAPWYNRDGDCIHYHWRKDEFYADYVDDKLTLYRSQRSDDAVGCEIKGVAALIRKLGDFGMSLSEKDGTPLALFVFLSQSMGSRSKYDAENRQQTYRYLIEQVGKRKVEVHKSVRH